jgi:hypothetical protein
MTNGMNKALLAIALAALSCGSAAGQSRPADFISVTVGKITPAAVDGFARVLFEVTNKSPVTYSTVLFKCSAYDADKKLMGVSVASVSNLGPETTPGGGMINVNPHLGRNVKSASCRVEMVVP